MSIRKVKFVPGEYYHIYNRGNNKRIIFHDNGDYNHFIKLLYISNSARNIKMRDLPMDFFDFDRENRLVYIGAYCLMSNHFHLIITPIKEGNISKFMQKLTTAYSMYYNAKYQKTGSLFQGKYKSEYASNDRYLKYLFSYLHLNPIKLIQKDWKEKGIIDKNNAISYLNKYKYSSYLDYLGLDRDESVILDRKEFPTYFPTKNSFQKEIFEWLSFKD